MGATKEQSGPSRATDKRNTCAEAWVRVLGRFETEAQAQSLSQDSTTQHHQAQLGPVRVRVDRGRDLECSMDAIWALVPTSLSALAIIARQVRLNAESRRKYEMVRQ